MLPVEESASGFLADPDLSDGWGDANDRDGAFDGLELWGGAVIDVRKGGRIKLVDHDPDDRDPYVIQPDYGGKASNGYVHGIGRVLRPFDMP